MNRLWLLITLIGINAMSEAIEPAIVIHGGAGTLLREHMTAEAEAAHRQKLAEAVDAGYAVLSNGGPSVDAVTAALVVLEDSPLFNAGRGAVYTHDGAHELDASIMRGEDLNAGAVAGVQRVKNPILAARAVMEHSVHVMLSGDGADAFAAEQQLDRVDNDYFDTDFRRQQWQKLNGRVAVSEDGGHPADEKFGTVGAVAIDVKGHITAATSTGGMTNKRYGRIGDSPVIGAGTYAKDGVCGVSATGHGEYFIRHAVAHDICARTEYLNQSVQRSAEQVILEVLKDAGGEGGIVALDGSGRVVMVFNSKGMYRAHRSAGDAAATVGIYAAGSETLFEEKQSP